MMDLILWRHAQALDLVEGEEDVLRPLTQRGQKQAAQMAAWLHRHLPEGARVLASPALRTEQTAHALSRPYHRPYQLHPELLPGGAPQDLLALVQWPSAQGTVLVVGHQPLLGQVAAQLLGMQACGCSVRKGAVWWLRQRQRLGTTETVLLAVQSPELL